MFCKYTPADLKKELRQAIFQKIVNELLIVLSQYYMMVDLRSSMFSFLIDPGIFPLI